MKRLLLYLWLFLVCCTSTQAAFVVVGPTQKLSAAQKLEIFKRIASSRFPDINDLTKVLGAEGVQVIYIPDTTYQILESTLINVGGFDQWKRKVITDKNPHNTRYRVLRYSNFYGKSPIPNSRTYGSMENLQDLSFYNIQGFPYDPEAFEMGKNYEQGVMERGYYNTTFCEDFWALNDYIKSLGQTFLDLDNKARNVITEGKSAIVELIPSEQFYERITAQEFDAYENRRVLLWRYSRGLGKQAPHWIDSIFKMPISHGKPALFKENDEGISFNVHPLDNSLFCWQPPLSPYVNHDYGSAPSCALLLLWDDLEARRRLEGMPISPKVRARLEELAAHTLFCLAVPEDELEALHEFVYEGSSHVPFFAGLRAQGDYSHSRIYTRRKRIVPGKKEKSLAIWETIGSLPPISDKDCAILARAYFKWMADNMTVFYTGNKFTWEEDRSGPIHAVYRDFYTVYLKDILETFGDREPLVPLTHQAPMNIAYAPGGPGGPERKRPMQVPPALAAPSHNAIRRLEELSKSQEAAPLSRIQLLLTAHDPETGYDFRFRSTPASYTEKRTIIKALVADVFHYYRQTHQYITPDSHREIFSSFEDKFPISPTTGYTSDDARRLYNHDFGHYVLVRSCIYAISDIFQGKQPQWGAPLPHAIKDYGQKRFNHYSSVSIAKRDYFNDLGGSDRQDFKAFVLTTKRTLEKELSDHPY
jgi:hypothetical protein